MSCNLLSPVSLKRKLDISTPESKKAHVIEQLVVCLQQTKKAKVDFKKLQGQLVTCSAPAAYVARWKPSPPPKSASELEFQRDVVYDHTPTVNVMDQVSSSKEVKCEPNMVPDVSQQQAKIQNASPTQPSVAKRTLFQKINEDELTPKYVKLEAPIVDPSQEKTQKTSYYTSAPSFDETLAPNKDHLVSQTDSGNRLSIFTDSALEFMKLFMIEKWVLANPNDTVMIHECQRRRGLFKDLPNFERQAKIMQQMCDTMRTMAQMNETPLTQSSRNDLVQMMESC
jgi:hypothetical protein